MQPKRIRSALGNAPDASAPGAVCRHENFHMHWNHWISGANTTPTPVIPFCARRLHDSGTTWAAIEPSQDSFSWTLMDNIIAAVEAIGARAWYLFGFTPTWASSDPGTPGPYGLGCKAPPTAIADWIDYVARVMQRYGPRLMFVEGWNEPNLLQFWTGSLPQLVALQNAMYDTVKANSPGTLVISPSPTGVGSNSQSLNATYLRSLAALGAKWDIVGAHAYVDTSLSMADQTRRLWLLFQDLANYAKETNKQGIITESGQQAWATLSEQDKERYLKRAMMLSACLGLPYTWYSYDVAATGDILSTTRRQWWIDWRAALVDKFVRFVSIAPDGTVTVTVDGASLSF